MEPGGETMTLRALLEHLEGQCPPAEAAATERALADDAGARRELEELQSLLAGVARPLPELAGVDLVEGVRGQVLQTPRRPARLWRRAALLGLAASLVTVALGLWIHQAQEPAAPTGGFQARRAPVVSHVDRWAGVKVFHRGEAGAPRPLSWQLPAGHGLLVAYSNLGPAPHRYLMVFAVDQAGEVHWLHPAYERPGTNPSSISISAGADVELSQIVFHKLARGPLAIYGLFSREPLKVLDVEQLIRRLRGQGRRRAEAPPRLPVAETAQHVLRTWVVP